VALETRGHVVELLVSLGKSRPIPVSPRRAAVDRLRRADAGDHVLALCVDQVLAEEPLLAGRRVAREGGRRSAAVEAAVAEDHRRTFTAVAAVRQNR
jgi:hypothetical protein